MMKPLDGKRIAFLATDGVEQVELTEPLRAVRDAGGHATLVSLKAGPFQGFHHLDKAETFMADLAVADVTSREFDGLVLPGGVANPDALRGDEHAVRFVREFFAQDKPVAAICHAPWMLIEAEAARGRTLTSWPSLKTDIRNAGGTWVDERVVVDQLLITSRKPDDLPAFCAKVVELFGESRVESRVDEMSEESFPASDSPSWGGSSIGASRPEGTQPA